MRQTTNTTLLLLCMVLMPIFMFAQRTVSGKITDTESGQGLVGVSVLVVGTTTGATSGADGAYSVKVPDGATELRFSFFGYDDVTASVEGLSNFNVSLTKGKTLDEVVLIGYGEVKKEDATGSVTSVDSDVFNKGAITNPQDLLAGKVAGVSITPGAEPGAGAVIRIRGGSSLSASNDPLIVIDGVPVANDGIAGSRNPLNIINPNDIESFTVLKDASATAIYGSRASNGVIIITTKKGQSGKMKVGYNGSFAVSNRVQSTNILNATEFSQLINEQFEEGHPARGLLGTANTDWQNEIFQQGVTHDHNLNLSGKAGSLPYRVSLGYTDRTGILKTDRYSRQTASVNLSPSYLDGKLQINIGAKGMLSQNNFADAGAIGTANSIDPTQPVNIDDQTWGGYFFWADNDGNPNNLAPANPVALLEQRENTSDVFRYILNGSVSYRIIPELTANLNLALDAAQGQGTDITRPEAAFAASDTGRYSEYSNDKSNRLLDFYLNYNKDLGKQNFDVTAGYSFQRFYRDDFNFATNFSRNDTLSFPNTFPKETFLISVFARLNYKLGDNFLATVTYRRDGSSRFAEGNQWGNFPSAALAYKIVNNGGGLLSNLKLRLGVGLTGQQDIGPDFYPALARYQLSTATAQYQFGDQFIQTYRPNGYDANLKWEETVTYNVGLDYEFAKGRVSGSLEVYQRDTRDLLNFVPVPAGTNLTNFITTNVGDLQNRGLEFSINATPILTEKVSWDVGFNVNLNQNEIKRLTATEDPNYLGVFTGNISGGVGNTIQIHSVGFPASSFFVYEQVYDENGTPIEGLYVDRNDDGTITPEDRYRLNQPTPTAVFGFTSNLALGNFEFLFAGRANVGNYIYNNVWSNSTDYNGIYGSTNFLRNRNAEATAIDFNVPQYFSDHFIRDGSFLRLDHVTLSYDLGSLVNKINMLKVNLVVQNPLVLTQYDGIDPEIFGGIDNNIYPRSRTILLGVNAAF